MAPNTQQPANGKRTLWRVLRSTLFVTFVNPYALVAAAIAVWLITHFVTTLLEGKHLHEAWSLAAVLHCYACITALAIIAVLAMCHLIVTFLAGMRKD